MLGGRASERRGGPCLSPALRPFPYGRVACCRRSCCAEMLARLASSASPLCPGCRPTTVLLRSCSGRPAPDCEKQGAAGAAVSRCTVAVRWQNAAGASACGKRGGRGEPRSSSRRACAAVAKAGACRRGQGELRSSSSRRARSNAPRPPQKHEKARTALVPVDDQVLAHHQWTDARPQP